jgi:hypothetical protein
VSPALPVRRNPASGRREDVQARMIAEWTHCSVRFWIQRVQRTPRPASPAPRREPIRHEPAPLQRVDDLAASRIADLGTASIRAGLGSLAAMLLLPLAGPNLRVTEWAGTLGAGLVVLGISLARIAESARAKLRVPHAIRRLAVGIPLHTGALRDGRLGLASQPGTVFRHADRLRVRLVAADLHNGARVPSPVPARHRLQLATSIILLRAAHGRRRVAPYGFLIYGAEHVRIDLDPALAREVEDTAEEVRASFSLPSAPPRNHFSAPRCRGCPFRDKCPDRLGPHPARGT